MTRLESRPWPAFFIIVLILAALAVPATRAFASEVAGIPGADGGVPQEFAPGEVLVKFKPGTTRGAAAVLAAELAAEEVQEFALLSEARRRPFLLLRSADRSTGELLAALQARPEVEAVSPNYRRRLQRLPNDPKYPKQWGMTRIHAPEAWERGVGSSGVVVAVIDTGVAYNHEDLAANMWRNPGEIPGNGIDDDNNGFIDDVYGFDFAADRFGANDSDPMDIDSHGTHVAGIMAAVGNNGKGVCGISWSARIMALKGFRPDMHIYDSDCIEAIEYAVMMKRDHGVNVVAINASFGGGGEDQLQKDAIAEAGANGIAFVCAAGNEGEDNDATPFYPAGYDLPGIISVAASDEDDQLASFSNYGATSVDIAAPGTGILSTVPAGKGLEAWLRSGSDTFDANPMEYSGRTANAGLSRTIYDCGRGSSAGSFPPGVNGNIALIERGDTNFAQKTTLAQNAGAVGVAIYNNAPGNFSGTLGSAGNWVPVISLSQEDGLKLKARGAHAVNLTSRLADYGLSDGTSMAAPHVCGALGLLAAQFPADDMAKRITRLYSGADRVTGLENRTKTGARLNLARALSQSLVLAMTVSRSQASAWVIEKDYAKVDFTVEKDPAAPISGETYVVYRKSAGGSYQSVQEIAAGEIQNGAFTYFDKYLERGTGYTYVIQARSAQGEVLALSNEQAI
ncbi:MAG: S8 family serine peptidase [Acidobacteria bacterium]|jgi:subtilisin family serine protease|nr:S8 family serine peptidase [Acidobacteriota bacterium]